VQEIPRILFIGELPPLTTNGISKMNSQFIDILRLRYNVEVIEDCPNKSIFLRFFSFFYSLKFMQLASFEYFYMNLPVSKGGALRICIISIFLKLRNRKVIFHLHRGDVDRLKSKTYRILFAIFFRRCRIVVLGESYKKSLQNYFPLLDFFVVNNFLVEKLDTVKFSKKQRIKFIYYSNILKTKGIVNFIDIANFFECKSEQYVFEIYGCEIEKGFLVDLPSNCSYKGPIASTEDKNSMFADADCLLFLSQNEGCSLVVMEAMRSGLPIICFNVGMNLEMLGLDYEYLLDEFDFQSVISSVSSFSAMSIEDRDLLSEEIIGRSSHLYSEEIAAHHFLSVFESFI
jgi:glycosyltransferase involved in cell wall biosynthesis